MCINVVQVSLHVSIISCLALEQSNMEIFYRAQEKLSDSFRQATAKIGATMGLEVTEDLVLNVPVMNQTTESQ